MIVTHQFNLPDDEYDYQIFNKSSEMHFVLVELDNYLRGLVKYSDLPADKYDMADEIRTKFYDIMHENNFKL